MAALAEPLTEASPFTVEAFEEWCYDLILDNGEPWRLESFQAEIVADIFAGYSEVWTVIPEGNAKTTLMGGLALHHGGHVLSAFVPIGASSREQAEIMYRQAEGFVYRTPKLKHRYKCQEGYRRIKCLETGGRIQVYAADDRTADGVIPTLAILDELHRHRDLRLYRTWTGKLRKRKGQIVAISTAGEPESEFEETRARIIKNAVEIERSGTHGSHIRAASKQIVLHDWAVRDRKKADDIEIVKEANPLSSLTVEELADKRASDTMTDAHWLRFVCNIPTRPEGQGVLPEDWDALEDAKAKPSPESVKYGWLDLGWKIDTSAIGLLSWETPKRRVVSNVTVVEPPVDEADIVKAILDIHEQFEPEGFVYDPNAGAQQMAQLLEKGEHPQQVERGVGAIKFIEHSQDNAPMSLAAVRLEEAIRTKSLVHNGDPDLRRHVLNAVKKTISGEKWKFDRPSDAKGERRSKYPIDALTGLLMGHSVAVAENDNPKPGGVFFL